MANVLVEETSLTNIANAIRSKNGTAAKYKPSEMANAISNITTSEDLTSELTTQNTLITTQETTIDDIVSALQNKSAGSGGSDNSRENGLVARTLTEYSNDTVTSIGGNAFYNYSGLESVNLPNVISIGETAFYNCNKLLILDFHKATTIGHRAFRNCSSLKTFILRSETVCTSGVSAFQSTPIADGTGYIYVPDNLVNSYKSATNWSAYANQIKGVSEL